MMTKIQQHLFMMRKFRMPWFLLASGLRVTGCSSFDEAGGTAKRSPDEFQVVVRPPLTLPPSFSLEPVDSSAKQESASDAISVTDQVLTQGGRADASSFDAVFGTDQIEPDIRTKIDEETLGIQIERRLPIEILFGGQPNIGPELSAEAEAKRIRDAIKNGESPTDSPTLAIDPVINEPVKIK